MNIVDYLRSLGWDANKWTVLKEEEWQPLTKVNGYQNNIFDAVKDPNGKKEFGKNARIVEKKWMNKHMASVTNTDLPEAPKPAKAPPAPPEPPKAKEVPAVPEAPKVPEKLQEVADASPNVVIASIDKGEEEEPKKNESGINVGLRIAQLENTGWKKEEDFYVAKNGNKIKIDYLGTIDDNTFYKTMADGNTKVKEEKEEDSEATVDKIKAAQKAEIEKRKKVEEEGKAKRKADAEKGETRLNLLVKNGCKEKDVKGIKAVITPDGKAFSSEQLASMDNEKWMKMTNDYSAKAVADMLFAQAEQEAAEQKAESDSKKKQEEADAVVSVEKESDAKEAEEAAKAAIDKGKEETEEEFVNDLKGKIIDKETIEVEMPMESTEEKQAGVTPKGTPSADNSMTTGDQGGFFHALSKLGFGQPNLSLKPLADGKFQVVITMEGEVEDYNVLQLVSDASIKTEK